MTIEQYEKEVEHLGETRGLPDHDHDMIHELSRRLDALWRYDQYISNASDFENIKNFWQKMKDQEQKNIAELK
ncbi:MAG: hypothetical protein GTO02_00735, partial [Candidatus Dadabacteria bacterium]|nr:hypothetical protein [Candidatus Dadabacteria bacterium]NIQ12971.1 hypothetical protein [Candidatus Dadabacteria bacterium]